MSCGLSSETTSTHGFSWPPCSRSQSIALLRPQRVVVDAVVVAGRLERGRLLRVVEAVGPEVVALRGSRSTPSGDRRAGHAQVPLAEVGGRVALLAHQVAERRDARVQRELPALQEVAEDAVLRRVHAGPEAGAARRALHRGVVEALEADAAAVDPVARRQRQVGRPLRVALLVAHQDQDVRLAPGASAPASTSARAERPRSRALRLRAAPATQNVRRVLPRLPSLTLPLVTARHQRTVTDDGMSNTVSSTCATLRADEHHRAAHQAPPAARGDAPADPRRGRRSSCASTPTAS